jgi:hypothetical protein
MYVLKFFQPNQLIFLLVGFLSSITSYGFQATTKITWDEYHGFPFAFIKLTGCYGPCYQDKIGYRYLIDDFDLNMFLLDMLIWYVTACLFAYGLSTILKVKAIVTDKR